MQKKFLKSRRYLAIGLLVCLCFCQIQEFNMVSATEYTEQPGVVKEIDLGDYQSQMTV